MRTCGRPKRKWEANIKMNLKEIECEDVDWIYLAQDISGGGSCEHGNELPGTINACNFSAI
jgi:hypothetical protein